MFYSLPPVGSKIYLRDILKSIKGSLTNPHVMEDFKEAIEKYFGVKHCLLINSGRAALTAILMALKQGDDQDEVIIPSYTCFSVPAAIVRAGLKIGLCDIELETLDFNYGQMKEIISERTLAIIPCHLFGLVCNMNRVIEIAKTKKVWVIEDAAQAMGAKLNGKYVGTMGDVGFFSLGRGKPMTTMGGGIIVTNDDHLAAKISSQLDFLIQNSKFKTQNFKLIVQNLVYSIFLNPRLYWIPELLPFLHLGETVYDPNFKIGSFTTFQAQEGLIALRRLEEENTLRYQKGKLYFKMLIERNRIISPKVLDSSSPIYLRYPIIFENGKRRDAVWQAPRGQCLGVKKMYPSSIRQIEGISSHITQAHDLQPSNDDIAGRLLTLPTHLRVSQSEILKIQREVLNTS
jgi:perosamine synthetase